MASYDPEAYWSRVAQEIEKRGENVIAGDDNPYNRYKRRKFLRKFLDTIDFQSKKVLEVGCGPGGNLRHIAARHQPEQIFGADISALMLQIAGRNLSGLNVNLTKIDGARLPYDDQAMDVSFTVTVLHHNSDEATFESLARELARVTKKTLVIMEDVGSGRSKDGEWIARSTDAYKTVIEPCGFRLVELSFLNTKISRKWYQAVRERFIPADHREGEPMGRTAQLLAALPMPLTRMLDEICSEKVDLAKMVFERA